MRLAALVAFLVFVQDVPDPVKETAKKELGEKAIYKVHKNSDGSFTLDTKTTSVHVAASGEMIEKDETIALDKAPKAVQDFVKKEFEGKKVETTKWTKVSYEVKSGAVKMRIGYDGAVLRRDTTIKADEAPEAVTKAAKAKVEGGTVSKVKKILEDGAVRYKVTIVTADKKKVEVSFSEDGKEIP